MTNEELVLRFQRGEDAQETLAQLYAQNIGLINSVINKCHVQKQDEPDLRQESFFAIRRAAELWTEDKGAKFSTYAAAWIRQTITRYIEDYANLIRIPSHRYQRINFYKRTINELREDLGRDPTNIELAAALDIIPGQLDQLKSDALALNPHSLSEPMPGTENLLLEDAIPAPDNAIEDIEDRIQRQQLSVILWELIDALDQKEQQVIRGIYHENKTISECSAALGMSQSQVRATEWKALDKLGRSKNRQRLKPFADEILTSSIYNANGLHVFKYTGSSSVERYVIAQETRRNGHKKTP